MWKSLSEFAWALVSRLWVIVAELLGAFGIWQFFDKDAYLEGWQAAAIFFSGVLVAAFLPFHQVRVERDLAKAQGSRVSRFQLELENLKRGVEAVDAKDLSNTASRTAASVELETHQTLILKAIQQGKVDGVVGPDVPVNETKPTLDAWGELSEWAVRNGWRIQSWDSVPSRENIDPMYNVGPTKLVYTSREAIPRLRLHLISMINAVVQHALSRPPAG